MEVHPPDHAIHTWRDFLIHMATITLGLLIALGLEGLVENLHHRHLVREARENIRREMESNEREAAENTGNVKDDAARMKSNMERVKQLRTNPRALEHGSMEFSFTWSSFEQSAWQSARDSGALTYMPTAEVQGYADVYNQQEIVNRDAVDLFREQSLAAAPLIVEKGGDDLRPEEVEALTHDAARSYIRLLTLNEMIASLQQEYVQELKK